MCVVRAKSQGDVEKSLQRFYQAEVLVPSPIPPHLIVFPKKSLKLTRKRDQVKRRGSASQAVISEAVISKAPNSSTGCVTEQVAAEVQSGAVCPDVLESVGRRLFLQFVAWLLSRLFYCYFDLMIFVTFSLADSLQPK